MKLSVDLNADLGEGSGHDSELFELITSANIATGFHAGDSDTMHAAISKAKQHGVSVGAHPSFFDRENFGRKELRIPNEEVFDAVAYQLGIFQAIATALDVQWVVEAYALLLSALLLVGGSLGDHYGRRRIFLLGIAIFALASGACGFAENIRQ